MADIRLVGHGKKDLEINGDARIFATFDHGDSQGTSSRSPEAHQPVLQESIERPVCGGTRCGKIRKGTRRSSIILKDGHVEACWVFATLAHASLSGTVRLKRSVSGDESESTQK